MKFDKIPDLTLDDFTIKSLSEVLIIGDSDVWCEFVSERSEPISEFLKSRSLGFFDKEKYPD